MKKERNGVEVECSTSGVDQNKEEEMPEFRVKLEVRKAWEKRFSQGIHKPEHLNIERKISSSPKIQPPMKPSEFDENGDVILIGSADEFRCQNGEIKKKWKIESGKKLIPFDD